MLLAILVQLQYLPKCSTTRSRIFWKTPKYKILGESRYSKSDLIRIYKASIETYSENLSDGVIAPMFYLALFGIEGALSTRR